MRATRATGRRAHWVVAVVAASALLVGVLLALGVATLSDGGPRPPLSDQLTPVLAPVASASSRLGDEVNDAKEPDDLARVGEAADGLAQAVSIASQAVWGLDVEKAERHRLPGVRAALGVTGSFARRVVAAAEAPSAERLDAMDEAGAVAREAWAAVSAQSPGLSVPAEQTFPAARPLAAVGYLRETQRALNASGETPAHSYVKRIDELLAISAETSADLARVVGDGMSFGTGAQSRIADIVSRRQVLRDAVAAITPPAPFRRSGELLSASLALVLADDAAVQAWVHAWFTDDEYGAENNSAIHRNNETRVRAAKQAFADEYDRVRLRLRLGRSPLGERY